MKRTHLMAMLALAALALVAAGCGSSGPSNAAFVSKANAICASAVFAANHDYDPNQAAQVRTAEVALATVILKLETLSVPSDKATAVHSYLSAARKLDALLIQEASALSKHDAAKAQAIANKGPVVAKAGSAAAKAVGISSNCS